MAAHHHHLTAASPSWKLAWLNCRHISNITEPYRTWFSETGARLAAQDDKLLKLQSQLDQQQSDLTAVRSEVHTLAETLHKAMQMSFQSMRQDLANELTNVITSKADWFGNHDHVFLNDYVTLGFHLRKCQFFVVFMDFSMDFSLCAFGFSLSVRPWAWLRHAHQFPCSHSCDVSQPQLGHGLDFVGPSSTQFMFLPLIAGEEPYTQVHPTWYM